MVEPFGEDWLRGLEAAARHAGVRVEEPLVIEQVITGEGGEAVHAIEIGTNGTSVRSGRADHADLTFTTDRATAGQIARGELSAQAAFMSGRLRVGGDLQRLTREARALTAAVDSVGGVPTGATD